MIIDPFILKEQKEEIVILKKDIEELKKEIFERLVKDYINIFSNKDKNVLRDNIKNIIYKHYKKQINSIELENKMIEEILDRIYGYGLLNKYIKDPITTDIRVVFYNEIYLKQKGFWVKAKEQFEDEKQLEEYIRFCAIKNGCIINFENPIVIFSDKENRLRIEAGISPSNSISPSLVIRIHKENKKHKLEELMLHYKMFEKEEYQKIIELINNKRNIIICGQGGSGKTTLLRAILEKIPQNIPITTNEETTELYLYNRNVIQRECILNRNENKNIDLEKLAKHSLVMSNDIIVIGEIKGAEANVFFDSLSTGHMGLATVHTDSVYNVLSRLITLIKKDIKAQYYTEQFLKKFLVTSINAIIFMKDFKIKDFVEIIYDDKTEQIKYIQIFQKQGAVK